MYCCDLLPVLTPVLSRHWQVRAENLELMKANNVSFDGRDDTEYQRLKQEIRWVMMSGAGSVTVG